MVTTDAGRELLRDIHPDRELLQRLLPPKWRRLTKDDVTAARIVIANSNSILYLALKRTGSAGITTMMAPPTGLDHH